MTAVVWPGVGGAAERVVAGLCPECRPAAEPEAPRETPAMRRKRLPEALRKMGVNVDGHGHCRLSNFDAKPDRHALEDAKRVGAGWKAGDRRNWFLFSVREGEPIAPGAGKTHLTVGLLAELYVQGLVAEDAVVFVRETRVAATLRRLINGGSPEDYLDRLIRVPLLVLDDVGKVRSDSAWLRELFFELYAGREGKPTWVTSNYSLSQLEGRDEVYLAIGSRLAAGAILTELSGPDRRLHLPETSR